MLRFKEFLSERDYAKERENYLGTPEQMKRNAGRSRARRLAIKKGLAKRGDGKEDDAGESGTSERRRWAPAIRARGRADE